MGKIAFLFAGQGAQYVGMGQDLYEGNDVATQIFDMGESLRPGTKAMCFEGPGEELTKTENTQPCLFLTDLACAEALRAAGVQADAVAGFSLGEIPALAYTGMLSREDAFKLVELRGKTMAKCAEENPGSMVAALKLSNEEVEAICAKFENVYPVNYNCPGQISCAGAVEELDDFVAAIKEAGGRGAKLQVSGAFHTPYMKNATEALSTALAEMEIKTPEVTMYSNLLGDVYPESKEEVIKTISAQASNSVQWEKLIRKMYEAGVDTFIEVGAGTTLSGLFKRMGLENIQVQHVADQESLKATLEALGK